MSVFEFEAFSGGTRAIAEALSKNPCSPSVAASRHAAR